MDREQIIKYAEERLSKLHPDEKEKDHIGLMVTSGWLKEVVKLLNQDAGKVLFFNQVTKLNNCNNCGIKDTCEHCPGPGGQITFNCPLWSIGRLTSKRFRGANSFHTYESKNKKEVEDFFKKTDPDLYQTSTRIDPETLETIYVLKWWKRETG